MTQFKIIKDKEKIRFAARKKVHSYVERDHVPETHDYMPHQQDQDSADFCMRAYRLLPEQLQKKLIELSGQDLAGLAADDVWWYREAHMAKNIAECFAAPGAKGITHVGAFYAYALDLDYAHWWSASQYLGLLTPKLIATVFNAVTTRESDPAEVFSHAFWNVQHTLSFSDYKLLSRSSLPNGAKEILIIRQDEMEFDITSMFDYYISVLSAISSNHYNPYPAPIVTFTEGIIPRVYPSEAAWGLTTLGTY